VGTYSLSSETTVAGYSILLRLMFTSMAAL
jgi:hypothetical protein